MDNPNNLVWHPHTITGRDRARHNAQRPFVVWFTGLSGSGKSTLAGALEERLFAQGHRCYLLDGDNIRHGLNKDLGFGDADRVENIRRVGELCKILVDAGLIVIAGFISPFARDRAMVRHLLEPGEFVEVHLNAPLAVCEQRDPKGLYRKARAGEIRHVTPHDMRSC
ncbi:MAG: adenylyl-sulfate kinase [Sulfuritalea sp.]|nr:adenylyl-sulfate kinase [Sulfuritalea sp.]